jgi:serine protease Do
MKAPRINSLFLGLVLVFIYGTAYAYKLPGSKPMAASDNLLFLQKVSKGISELALKGSKAIVFVSVSKTVRGRPFGEVDPFEFFFGPQYRERRPERKQKGLGSGFFVDLNKGYIITNNHVIEGAEEITLKLANGSTQRAKVLGRDKNTDVAVVQINDKNFNRKGLAVLSLGNSDKIRVGEMVIALGAPFGLESSLSFGVLSARGRGNLNITTLGNFMQTDAAINPGNSGGPLLSASGEVIGMNTAIYSRSGSSAGIGFAVPSNLVRSIAHQLIENGSVSRGFLGVRLQPLDDDISLGFGLPEGTEGIVVVSVQPGAPAAKAGLEDGDVIIAIEGKKVRDPSELTNAIGLLSPGSKVKVTYFRNGKKANVTAILANYPGDLRADKASSGGANRAYAGLKLRAFSKNNADYKRHKELYMLTSNSGLLVLDVALGSSAAAAGLRQGDLILQVNRRILRTPQNFKKIYASSKKLLIRLERGGDFLFASIRK